MTRYMTTWNVYELTTWLDKCVDRIYTKKLLKYVMSLMMLYHLVDIGLNRLTKFVMKIMNMRSIWMLVSNWQMLIKISLQFGMVTRIIRHGKECIMTINHLNVNVVVLSKVCHYIWIFCFFIIIKINYYYIIWFSKIPRSN